METVMKYMIIFLGMLAVGFTPATSHAEETAKFANLDGDVQALKKELMSLNRDLIAMRVRVSNPNDILESDDRKCRISIKMSELPVPVQVTELRFQTWNRKLMT